MTRKGSERDTQIRQTSLNAMAKKKQKVEEELLTQGSRSAPNNKQKWIRAWRKNEMNEGRGREEHEILCSK